MTPSGALPGIGVDRMDEKEVTHMATAENSLRTHWTLASLTPVSAPHTPGFHRCQPDRMAARRERVQP